MNKIITIVLFLSVAIFAFSASYTVLNINVAGNTYIASSTIEEAITLQPAKSYQEADIKSLLLESAKKIMALGYFYNVAPQLTKGILPNTLNITFKVWENPVVKEVKFKGMNLIKKSSAQASSTIQTGKPLNILQLRNTLQNIFDLYRKAGYSYSVDINTNVSQTATGLTLPNNILVIQAKEYAIYSVEFKGEIVGTLKDMEKLVTFKTVKKIENEPPIIKWIDQLPNTSGFVKDQDILSLRYKLLNTGYYSSVDMQKSTLQSTITKHPNLYNLVFILKKNNFIKENQKIKKVILSGVSLVNKNFLYNYIISKASTVTSVKNISDLINDVKDFYKDRNYIGIDVSPNYNSDTKTLTLKVLEKKIRSISYSGDVILKKSLLDKNLRIHTGQPMKLSGYISTIRNLQMTGYFKNVNIIPTPVATDDNLLDVTVNLEAKKYLGTFGGGISWQLDQSKIDDIWSNTPNKFNALLQIIWQGIAANLKVTKSNLTGIGDDGAFNFIAGTVKKDISLSYKVNWIGGTNFSPDFSVFYKNDYDQTTMATSDLKESYGVGLQSSYSINDFNSVALGLNVDHYKTYTATSTLSDGMEWSILSGYTYDGRDNPSFPRQGFKFSLNNELKFLDLSTFQYNKTKASFSLFYEPFTNFVLASNIVGGYIYPITTNEDLFYLGGSNSVRGWGTADFPSISGTRMLQVNLEMRYKMKNGLVLIPGFYDFGHTGGKSISSIGAGIGTIIPMFGTIQLGMVYPLNVDKPYLNYYIGFGGIF